MSLNDHPHVTRAFKSFQIRPVGLKYSCMKPGAGDRSAGHHEFLIRNY